MKIPEGGRLWRRIRIPGLRSSEKTTTPSKVRVNTKRTNKYPGEGRARTRNESSKDNLQDRKSTRESLGGIPAKRRRNCKDRLQKSTSYWPSNISREKEKIRGVVPLNLMSKISKMFKGLVQTQERWPGYDSSQKIRGAQPAPAKEKEHLFSITSKKLYSKIDSAESTSV